jgi:hypothetical protein
LMIENADVLKRLKECWQWKKVIFIM